MALPAEKMIDVVSFGGLTKWEIGGTITATGDEVGDTRRLELGEMVIEETCVVAAAATRAPTSSKAR